MNKIALEILKRTAKKYGVTVAEICGPSRKQSITRARRNAIRYVRCETYLSLREIGDVFGCRDHATILQYLEVSPDEKSQNAL